VISVVVVVVVVVAVCRDYQSESGQNNVTTKQEVYIC